MTIASESGVHEEISDEFHLQIWLIEVSLMGKFNKALLPKLMLYI